MFVVIAFNSNAQPDSLKIDSLKKVLLTAKEDRNKVNTLNQFGNLIVQDRNNAMQYAKQALALSQKLNFKNEEGTADYNCAVALAGISYVGP